jgi:hypothetical protein
MDRRERKDILGQWGVRAEDPRESEEGKRLHAELAGSPVTGRPIELRRRHFRPSVDSYVASLGGPLPYMIRLREIERKTHEAKLALAERWLELAAECDGDAALFARRWRETAERWSFDEVNDLVDRHNRWYPVEARLPMDVRRRDYVLVGGEPYTRERLDGQWVLARFPADLDAARRAAT